MKKIILIGLLLLFCFSVLGQHQEIIENEQINETELNPSMIINFNADNRNEYISYAHLKEKFIVINQRLDELELEKPSVTFFDYITILNLILVILIFILLFRIKIKK